MELQNIGKHRTDATKDLITQAYNALTTISWFATVQGFSGSVSIECLAAYMTKEWLTDEHENQMLHLLRLELARGGEGEARGIYIADTTFMPSLIGVHKNPDQDIQYATAKNSV